MAVRLPVHSPNQRIGLYGGSFNPAHQGHVTLARHALKKLKLDRDVGSLGKKASDPVAFQIDYGRENDAPCQGVPCGGNVGGDRNGRFGEVSGVEESLLAGVGDGCGEVGGVGDDDRVASGGVVGVPGVDDELVGDVGPHGSEAAVVFVGVDDAGVAVA